MTGSQDGGRCSWPRIPPTCILGGHSYCLYHSIAHNANITHCRATIGLFRYFGRFGLLYMGPLVSLRI